MHSHIRDKLRRVAERHEEIHLLMTRPEVVGARDQLRALSVELAAAEPIVGAFTRYRALEQQCEEAQRMLEDEDGAIRTLAREELPTLETALAACDTTLQQLLLPKDPNDRRNLFLEIRAGTGGDEAALFAGDLFRMYHAYAEACGFDMEVLSRSEGEHGGYKEIISRVAGKDAYARLKFESGVHRVQRVPQTESQGRIHTSACTVAVLAEADPMEDEVDLPAADLRIDTFRASGAGGQHVNKTDSAIRITHRPSGIVVECQEQRSQHKNRARAMAMLRSRLRETATRARDQARANERKSMVGSGDRSERIRTYNFPQGRVTDHRIGLTLYQLDEILGGRLDAVIEPLLTAHQAEQLAQLQNR